MQEQASMQEMLKRKNLVTNGSAFTMQAPEMPMPTAAASAMSQARSGGAPMNKNVPEALLAAQGQGNPIAGGAPDVQHDPEAAAQSLADSNTDPSVVAALEGLGVLAAGTAAAYATYRAMKSGPSAPSPLREGMVPQEPVEGHFVPVDTNRLEGPQGVKRVRADSAAKRIEAPRKALPAPSTAKADRRASAEALKTRSAKGGPTDVGTIRGEPPIRTITEPVDAGVGRTLGVPQEVIKMLKANPGLAKLIGRGL